MLTTFSRTTCALGALLTASALYTAPARAQSQNEHDEIIVTGSLLSATSNENLIGVSVLTSEELQQRMSGSLGETLKFEPGISSSFFGAGASRPIIRGQGGLRVLLLDNGIGSIDASSASPDHAAAVEPAMASRIEVIRGSGLLRYGSSASGGVINVIDGRIPQRVPSAPVSGNARLGVSHADNGYEAAIGSDLHLGAVAKGDLVAHAELSHRRTQNYDIPDYARSRAVRSLDPLPAAQEVRGTLPNSATKATSLAAGLSYISDTFFVGGAVKDLSSAYGIPGGEGSNIELEQTRYDFTSKLDFSTGPIESLHISGGAADYQHKEIEASGATGTIFTNTGFETRAEIMQRNHGAWDAAHGVQYKQREFSAIGEEAFVPPTTTHMFGVFSFHELELGAINLEAAARYEHVRHKNSAGYSAVNSVHFDGLSGSLGMDYHISEAAKIGLSAYRTERAPTTEELFSNGPHLATQQFEIGNPNLGMETATGAELSFRYNANDTHVTLNVFHTHYDNYIYESITGESVLTDEGDSLAISRFTPANVVFQGFEVDTGAFLGQWKTLDINIDASLEYVDAFIKGGQNSPLPRIPPLGATFGLSADAGQWGVRGEAEYTSKKTTIAPEELPSDDFLLLNAFAHYDLNERITLRVSAHNLTNQDARQHSSFLKETTPLPGRNFKASLSVEF